MPFDGAQRIAGVVPGARIPLRADGEEQVKTVLEVLDAIEALSIEPAAAASTYWYNVGNRPAAQQPLLDYSTSGMRRILRAGALR